MNPLYVVLPMFIVFFIFLLTMNQYTALEWMLFLCFLCILGVVGTQYFLGVDLTATLMNFFTKPGVNIDIVTDKDNDTNDTDNDNDTNDADNTNSNDTKNKSAETYHIQGQFDYSMAKSVCKAYDATLASLSQIKDAYDKGAEWCDYGWSEDGMVLYPTQEESWKKYQKDKKDQCGIPGINGGYNRRTRQRLGVNCYGVKPSGKMPLQVSPVETTQPLPKHGTLSPFNYKAWSQF
jgi:hypothetical protein